MNGWRESCSKSLFAANSFCRPQCPAPRLQVMERRMIDDRFVHRPCIVTLAPFVIHDLQPKLLPVERS